MVQFLEFTSWESTLIHQVGDQYLNFAILQLNANQSEFEGLRWQTFLKTLLNGALVRFEGNQCLRLATLGKLLVK